MKTKTKLKRENRERLKTKKNENKNKSAKTAKLVTQRRSIQYGAYGCYGRTT